MLSISLLYTSGKNSKTMTDRRKAPLKESNSFTPVFIAGLNMRAIENPIMTASKGRIMESKWLVVFASLRR